MSSIPLAGTLIVNGNQITLPRNDLYKVPEITFYSIPLAAVIEFLKPISSAPSTTVFRTALGIRYEEGDGVPTSYRKAKALYKLAAADGGGTLWVYSPPVSKNDSGRVIPVSRGPKMAGLTAAKQRLAGLRARIVGREEGQ